jgi:glycosyltransferase involved in cell wall biosynthesis
LPPPTGARVVVTIYDCIAELFPERGPDPTIDLKRQIAERADLVVCISETTARDLVRLHGVARDKVRVIHLASSLPNPSQEGPLYPRPYLLFVGLRASYKNWGLLRRAYESEPRLYRNYDLVCFGGPSILIDERPLQGRMVRLSGSDQTLSNLYRHAAGLVYPTLYEGFGLPPLEAWQCSCPVFHCGGGSVEEVVGEAGLRLHSQDAGAFASALADALFDRGRIAGLIAMGRSRLARYSWERCAAAHAEAYTSLL